MAAAKEINVAAAFLDNVRTMNVLERFSSCCRFTPEWLWREFSFTILTHCGSSGRTMTGVKCRPSDQLAKVKRNQKKNDWSAFHVTDRSFVQSPFKLRFKVPETDMRPFC